MVSFHHGRTKLNLGGVWKYKLDEKDTGEASRYFAKDYDVSDWKTMNIPTNWYLTEVGDYFGTVWFHTTFHVPSDFEGKRLFLRFGAVDYYADVWLNGQYLGFHEGMFNPFEFDVTEHISWDGDNVLVVKDGAPYDDTEYIQVEFDGPPVSDPYKKHQAKEITQIKGHMIDSMHKNGSMTRFRQDGCSGGIWDEVELIARPDIYVDYAKLFTKIVLKKDWKGDGLDKPDGSALVAADVTIMNTTGKVIRTEAKMNVAPYNFDEDVSYDVSRPVVLQPGANLLKLVVTVPEAKLWWTWDYGKPNLYTATFTVEDDVVQQNFGIKEVKIDEDTGYWYLNGKRIFLRGMRYISSNWIGESNERMWSDDLGKMLDMNINSIRIGSHVEKDGFYTMCDEMGFLVWQVFPLHYCVSDSDDMIMRASDMIRDMGLMLVNHACIGMWSVFKEPEIYLLEDVPNNYHRLCQILKETLGTVDPVRWIHLGDYREGAQNLMIGACAPGDTDFNTARIDPQIVEFGAQSIPCLETLKTFIPEDKLWPPDWETWQYWGLYYNITFKNAKVPMGETLEEWIEIYQQFEANMVKEQIEVFRQRKYDPVASMYMYYWSDPAPMIGSGLLDYYRRPYKVYDAMKAVYTPVLVSLERQAKPYVIGREKFYDRPTTFIGKVLVTNDHPHALEATTIEWKIVRVADGEIMQANRLERIDLGADSVQLAEQIAWKIPQDAQTGKYRIDMQVTAADGSILSTNNTEITVR